MGMSLTEAENLPIAKYAMLFAEGNYRNTPENDKNAPDPPPEAFVLAQMRMLAERGVRIQ